MALQIDKTDRECGILLKLSGEVDLYTSPQFRETVIKAMKAQPWVAVDLSGVGYMDSSGVATLVEGLKAAAEQQKIFVLIAPSNPVMKVLQLARLDSVFTIQQQP